MKKRICFILTKFICYGVQNTTISGMGKVLELLIVEQKYININPNHDSFFLYYVIQYNCVLLEDESVGENDQYFVSK